MARRPALPAGVPRFSSPYTRSEGKDGWVGEQSTRTQRANTSATSSAPQSTSVPPSTTTRHAGERTAAPQCMHSPQESSERRPKSCSWTMRSAFRSCAITYPLSGRAAMRQRDLRVKNEFSAERREEWFLWGSERKRRRTGRSGGGWIRDLHEAGEERLGGFGAHVLRSCGMSCKDRACNG
jgi:hypothetical protein